MPSSKPAKLRFDGRYVAQLEGALWTLEMIEALRLKPSDSLIPQFTRIVAAVAHSKRSTMRCDCVWNWPEAFLVLLCYK